MVEKIHDMFNSFIHRHHQTSSTASWRKTNDVTEKEREREKENCRT